MLTRDLPVMPRPHVIHRSTRARKLYAAVMVASILLAVSACSPNAGSEGGASAAPPIPAPPDVAAAPADASVTARGLAS